MSTRTSVKDCASTATPTFIWAESKIQEAIAEIIRHPYTNVGMSDAGAHVDRTGSQGIATELLGYWVREKGLVSLEQAVNVLTFKVASIFGFKDRGLGVA